METSVLTDLSSRFADRAGEPPFYFCTKCEHEWHHEKALDPSVSCPNCGEIVTVVYVVPKPLSEIAS